MEIFAILMKTSACGGRGVPTNLDYHDPQIAEIYDAANPLGPDGEFYLALAGRAPLDVLDLGCGTGTLCLAFAERGHRVTGVEPATAMLEVAKRKPRAERVDWVETSAQSFRSSKRFDLIVMTGHAFQCLLTDVEMLVALETMRVHLKAGGRVAFETRNPKIDWAREWAARAPAVRLVRGDRVVESLEVLEQHREFISFTTHYRLADSTLATTSTLQFPSRDEVASLIIRAGLVVRNLFGDWKASAFDEQCSREIIFIAESAK